MTQTPPSSAEIRTELERVLASRGFRDAGRLAPFLRHLVERALEGETTGLKESVLGIEVFQRPADYDPRTDPIVRVEARRLRTRLDEYYEGEGAANPLRIGLPKGGYVPAFTARAPDARPPTVFYMRKAVLLAGVILPLLAVTAILLVRRGAPAPATGAATVAVLPFRSLDPDPANDYFADGLTEELIGRLARIPDLSVAARGLTAPFRGASVDLREAARQVGASVVVEGSVRRQQDRLRISARLVDAPTGAALWSETYDRPARDIFAIQDEIAAAVANALRIRMRPAAVPVPNRYTANIEAYQAYLRARQQANRYSAEGFDQAVRYYREALVHQPDYAPALAGLSQVYALAYYYNALPPGVDSGEPRRLAERAIALDPALAEAHAALGMILGMADYQWDAAEAAARRAIELDPRSALAHGLFAAAVLAPQGRFPEALASFRRALDLEPQISFLNFTYAFCLLASGDTTAAIEQYRRTLSLQNVHPDMEWDYGMALGFADRPAEAAEAFARARSLRGSPPGRAFGIEALFAGDRAQALQDAPRVDQAAREGRTSRMEAARIWAMLGEKDRALYWIEQAIEARETQAVWIKADPRLRSLRGDPRLDALAEKLGLAARIMER